MSHLTVLPPPYAIRTQLKDYRIFVQNKAICVTEKFDDDLLVKKMTNIPDMKSKTWL